MDTKSATNERHRATEAPERTGAEVPVATGEALLRDRLRHFVREEPWLAVATGVALGGVLGGLCFPKIGRFLFIATAGYVARGFWQHEGHLDIDDVMASLEGSRNEI